MTTIETIQKHANHYYHKLEQRIRSGEITKDQALKIASVHHVYDDMLESKITKAAHQVSKDYFIELTLQIAIDHIDDIRNNY